MAKKTSCPVTRKQFTEGAKPVSITIDGTAMQVPVKFFSTGSLGWYLNSKTTLKVNGIDVPVQIGLNMTLVGSKELPNDEAAPEIKHTSELAITDETTDQDSST